MHCGCRGANPPKANETKEGEGGRPHSDREGPISKFKAFHLRRRRCRMTNWCGSWSGHVCLVCGATKQKRCYLPLNQWDSHKIWLGFQRALGNDGNDVSEAGA